MNFLQLIKETAVFAWQSLLGNRLRTLLSLLGVVIGIYVIILIFTAFDSLKKNIYDSISSLGTDVIFVEKWPWESDGWDYPWWKFWQRPQADINEVQEIKSRAKTVGDLAFEATSNKTVSFKGKSISAAEIVGVGEDYERVQSIGVGEGRFFSHNDIQRGANVVVVGAEIAEGLFGSAQLRNQDIFIAGKKMRVIGVLEKKGSGLFDGAGPDVKVYIPYKSFERIVDIKSWRVGRKIIVKNNPNYTTAEMREELRGVMRAIRKLPPKKEDNFALNEPSMITKQLSGIFITLNAVGFFIGGLAMLVGGFGVANIMFVSVKERINIIGIQKSLGATRAFILLQFLFESLMLSLAGGFIGLLFVYLTSLLVQYLADFQLILTTKNIFTGIIISSIVGVVAGYAPARSASKMDPVEAIRSN